MRDCVITIVILLSSAVTQFAHSFDPENLAPCTFETISTIRCAGNEVTDETLKTLGAKMGAAEFRLLVIENTMVTTILNATFEKSVIENILIANNSRLVSIDSHAFRKSSAHQTLNITNNPKFSDQKVFALIKNLEPSDTINLAGNALHDIPMDAFRDLNTTTPFLVRQIYLSHNQITKIGSYAFVGLPQLHRISIDNNKLVSISSYAFTFTPTPNSHVLIGLYRNHLSADSFTVHAFGYPTHVSVELDLESNAFTSLPETTFRQFVSDDSKNKLYLYNNNFECDCGMSWIVSNSFIDNVFGVFCANKEMSIYSLTQHDLICA